MTDRAAAGAICLAILSLLTGHPAQAVPLGVQMVGWGQPPSGEYDRAHRLATCGPLGKLCNDVVPNGPRKDAAGMPVWLRRPRREGLWRRRFLKPAIAAAAVAVVGGLLTVPVGVMLVCGLVLAVASFWRLGSRRAGGTGVVPMAFLWSTLAALVLSVGAVAMRGLLPDASAPTAATIDRPGPSVGSSRSAPIPAATSIPGAVSTSHGPSVSQVELTPRPAAPATTAPPVAAAPSVAQSSVGAGGGSTAGRTSANAGGAPQPPSGPLAASSPSAASPSGSGSSQSPSPAARKSCVPTLLGVVLPQRTC